MVAGETMALKLEGGFKFVFRDPFAGDKYL